MSKAARQRHIRRVKRLASLAEKNPKLFEAEWEKRLESWLLRIKQDAGRLRDNEGKTISAIFAHVDYALRILEACGEDVWRQYAKDTSDLLVAECCRQFAGRVDLNLFRLNNYSRLENPY